MKRILYSTFLIFAFLFTCSNDSMDNQEITSPENPDNPAAITYKYLALGDSYTIGESVCQSCRFPVQLSDSLTERLPDSSIDLDIIAQTGWTTTNLQEAILSRNLQNNYDLVTLLIGVNNQYQGKDFAIYEEEFIELLDTAIEFADGDKNKVIVISIPDYAYTPFGQIRPNPAEISQEIDRYNSYARDVAAANNVSFINITDITREGLENPALVASDGLHPSTEAYSRFVERLVPIALQRIQ
ncbi:MAG: SGNH/GDSL hydrolase family protein [Flavobacteriaceae bacterium]|nr:SGNH/GDSL hydrolase family protein [Flavobacteriaceae bacterium]